MKLLKKVTILTVICAILYLAGALILAYTQMAYRVWVDVLGKMVVIGGLPLLCMIWTSVWLKQACKWSRIAKTIVILIEAVICAGWTFYSFLVLVFSLHTETMLTANLLITEVSGSYYEYSRPVTPFFKMSVEWPAEEEEEYLEKKYGREFQIADADNHLFCDTEFPQIKVSVRLLGMQFEDDFVESLLANLLLEGMEALDMKREYYIEQYSAGRNGMFYISLEDENDIPKLAEDICRLADYVCEKTDVFEENRGYLYFYCGEFKGLIPFGGHETGDEQEPGYYLHSEKMQEYIQEKYAKAAGYEVAQKEREETQKRWEASQREQEASRKEWEVAQKKKEEAQKEDAQNQQQEAYTDGEGMNPAEDPIETNAKIIYDEVLAEQGYTCEICYNAKGNLYLNLGSRPAGEPGDYYDTGSYRFTLVYDRTSKNYACELFVLYKEHYTGEMGDMSSNDTTAILDMYAVEIGTGKVVAADKQSWSDVGTKEYRELTGE